MKGSRRSYVVASVAVFLCLSGCLSGESPEAGFFISRPRQDVTVSGNVGDTLTAKAQVSINAADGEDLGEKTASDVGRYARHVEAPVRHYPLIVTAKGGENLVTRRAPEFVLRGAVISGDSEVTANANAFSTLAIETAKHLNGELSNENLKRAEQLVIDNMNSGLDSLLDEGPMSADIDGSNIAELVKASATLSEIFLRTRSTLAAAGTNVQAEDVIRALGADLIDGVIEGNGGDAADARIAATANAVTAHVLAESMTEELRMDGFRAMDAIYDAVSKASGGAASPGLAELTASAGMVAQWRAAVYAVAAVSNDPVTLEVAEIADAIVPGMSPDDVWVTLPAGWSDALGDAANAIAAADDNTIAAVNAAARSDGGPLATANRAPSISGSPPSSAAVGEPYMFVPRASDLDGDTLSFDIANRPRWLQFDASTGKLAGTPAAADKGVHENVRITVSDGLASSDIGPFSISVADTDSAPSISGNPATSVITGEKYSFVPRASDPDSDELAFSIKNKPAWANFSITDGRLTGTPQTVDVGSYRNIVISVSDASYTDKLEPFTIEVLAAGIQAGSVSVRWTPPTRNSNGSALNNLAGYRVYWRSQPGNFNNSMIISKPGVTRVVIDDLGPGNYDFAVTAFNSYGGESRFSNTTSKVVD